ncbi:class I SAM-dependent methyltransferase [Thalassovita taeanensis]|uniref:16S rRNA m(2)G 1207 methyltransferase n=1 Tax=Thalassovita taeanensis TaxID=657014 RepID=A0A1H9CPZ7_9RHOB|nr:class I SAM-dependent methyltransferase [Thalassovita taeanensis]SEQ03137.1 16S rRNA m(2)G 1207 methyltransferase [Thalassovita taeanensis]
MNTPRLLLALSEGGLVLPDSGLVAVFAPRLGMDLSALPQDRCRVITGFKPDFDGFTAAGFHCATDPDEKYAAAVVFLPRAKAQARALIAAAVQATPGGVIIVDGQKTDGVDSMLKDIRKRAEVSGSLSKAHGKIFWFTAPAAAAFSDWHPAGPAAIEGGFVTAPGVFSADGIDPASALLLASLPEKLGARVADFGAGWGFLSAGLLRRDTIKTLDLIEADHAALVCARLNVTDPRARFHWADATHWTPAHKLDTVVMNPPFHTARAADPDLGRAFIAAAAAALTPSGRLWLVANRHLPYEAALAQHFVDVTEVAGDNRFKIFCAARPSRHRR